MTVIHKKAWRSAFEKVLSGEKTFEIRLADWECSPGDVLVLDEVDDVTKQYTGRSVQKTVGYVAKLAELPGYWSGEEVAEHGLQVISLIDDH